jgi:hypothetical protein
MEFNFTIYIPQWLPTLAICLLQIHWVLGAVAVIFLATVGYCRKKHINRALTIKRLCQVAFSSFSLMVMGLGTFCYAVEFVIKKIKSAQSVKSVSKNKV